jgi:hypothetical protein
MIRFAAFVATSLTFSLASLRAEPAVFVDLPGGMIIGAKGEGGWQTSEQAGKELKAGRLFRLYTLDGLIGEATGGKPTPNPDVCPDIWELTLSPAADQSAIGVAAPWDPSPRMARKADVSQAVYQEAVRDFLIEKGFRDPVVGITELLRVDLDGDGEDEVLLGATNYSVEPDTTPETAAAGNYSFVLLRHIVDGKVRAQLVDGEFYPKPDAMATPNRYKVRGLLDLDGDGILEIVVESAYYEGGGIAVWKLSEGKLSRVLEMACGA